mgnify:CR=1 FL=1
MPEKEGFSRLKLVRRADMPPPPATPSAYVELGVASPFSFLRGASDAIELVQIVRHHPQVHEPAAERHKRIDTIVHAAEQDRLIQHRHAPIHESRERLRYSLVDLVAMIGMDNPGRDQSGAAQPGE